MSGLFDKDGETSSKRVIGAIMVGWCLIMGGYYIACKTNQTEGSLALIEFIGSAGCGLIASGIIEKFKK